MIAVRLVLSPPQGDRRFSDTRRKMKAAVMATFQSSRAVIISVSHKVLPERLLTCHRQYSSLFKVPGFDAG